MKELKFTKQTSTVALVFFIAYVIYGIFYTPWVQLVISLAVAGIAYGMTDSYEVAVIVLLVINYLFPFYRGSNMKGVTAYRMEGFTDAKANEVKKMAEEALTNQKSEVDYAVAQAELAIAVAQLAAIHRLREKRGH